MSAPTTNTEKKDHWNTQAYQSAAGFVPKLTNQVVTYLNPQPTDRILDIGCGDGPLTAQIAASAKEVLGLDASKSFIESAKAKYEEGNCRFELRDATQGLGGEVWDKVFSNAAMHWILRREETREAFFRDVCGVLKTGGLFAFEMGGKGNVAEIQTACIAALRHVGRVGIGEAREACPWFFPSQEWMRRVLEKVGFEVVVCEAEYRPSRLEEGALEGWVRLMCAEYLERVEEGWRREGVVRDILELVETVVTREEDGSQWLGYVRLRVLARKK